MNLELVSSDKTPPWKSSLPSRIMTSDASPFRVNATPLIDCSEIVPVMDLKSEFSDCFDLLGSLVGSGILDFRKKISTLFGLGSRRVLGSLFLATQCRLFASVG